VIGEIHQKTPVSLYQPGVEIRELTFVVKKDYAIGDRILNTGYEELNNYSPIDRDSRDRRTFYSFVDENVEDPQEGWKWRGTRGLARSRGMAMHAHLTARYAIPSSEAQNEKQEEDVAMSDVMNTVMEWITLPEVSNYRSSYLLATMGMLTSPVTYMGVEYFEIYQKVRQMREDGIYAKKEILDEVLSGPKFPVYSASQIKITNAYEQNIQRQRAILSVRYIDWTEAKAKYGRHENWQYVQPGVRAIYNESDGLFYDIKDEEHLTSIEEATWKSRTDDTEVCFLNGIYFGKEDAEANPIRHRDNRNAPKYDIVPFGYNRIGEHFYFYKSLMNEAGWDDQLMDAMWEVHMNREFLDAEPPIAQTGSDKIDSSIIFPGGITAFTNPDVRVSAILPRRGDSSLRTLQEIEKSLGEKSVSETQTGELPEASQKAYTVSQAVQSARVLMGGVTKSIEASVIQVGSLMQDIILQHLTVAELDELTGNPTYRRFILRDQTVDGKKVSKNILFEEALVGKRMSEEEQKYANLELLSESGYPEHKEVLYRVNPYIFSKRKYFTKTESEMMLPENEQYQQGIMSQFYQLVRQDPYFTPEALARKLAHTFFKGKGEELLAKNINDIMGQNMAAQTGQPTNQLGNMTERKQLARGMAGV